MQSNFSGILMRISQRFLLFDTIFFVDAAARASASYGFFLGSYCYTSVAKLTSLKSSEYLGPAGSIGSKHLYGGIFLSFKKKFFSQ